MILWGVGGLLVAVVVVVAVLIYTDYYAGDPSADDVAHAIRAVAPDACDGQIGVHTIDNLGGPGLPDGMQRAREITCDRRDRPNERLVIHYVFSSGDAAKKWLTGNDDRLGGRFGWWLKDRTLTGAVELGAPEWQRVRRALGGQ